MSVNIGKMQYQLGLDTAGFDAASARVHTQMQSMGEKITGVGNSMMKAGAVLTAFSVATVLAASNFVQLAGDLQTTQQRMEALTGTSADAKRIMGELYTYVLGKPIAFPDASKAATVLMGYGVSADKVVSSMKTLSAFSIVNGANMDQLALAYGQVNAKGRLMGQEIIQLTNNFVPVSKVIAKHFNVSVQKAMELMEGGAITAEVFNAAMSEYIPESKIAAMSNTFNNRMISMQGSLRAMGLAFLGVKMDKELGLVIEKGGLFDILSGLLPKIAAGLSAVGNWFKTLSPLGKNVALVIAAIAVAAGPLLLILGALISAIGVVVGVLSWPVVAVIAGIAAVIAIIVLVVDALGGWAKVWGQVVQGAQQLWAFLSPVLIPVFNMFVAMIRNIIDVLVEFWNANKVWIIPTLIAIAAIIGVVLASAIAVFIASWLVAIAIVMVVVNVIKFLADAIRNVVVWLFNVGVTVIQVFAGAYAFIASIFTAIWNVAIKPIIDLIIAYIRIVYNVYAFIFQLIYAVALAIWTWIWTYAIKPVIDWIVAGITWLGGIINNIWQGVLDFLRPIMDRIGSGFVNIWNWIVGVWNGAVGFFNSIFNPIKDTAKSVADGIGGFFSTMWGNIRKVFIDGVNTVIGIINGMVGTYNDTLGKLPGAPKMSKMAKLAKGTDFFAGGMALVGERGPEIVNLPRGSQVIPNDKIGTGTSIYGDINIGSKSDADYFFNRLNRGSDLLGMGLAE